MCVRLFIGSSTEGLKIAQDLQAYLENEQNYSKEENDASQSVNVRLWTDYPIFTLGETIQQSLVKVAQEYDFAALIFSADDLVISRNKEDPGPRDNVVFESGFFSGVLGFDRTYLVVPSGPKLKIPSDLAGLNHAHYTTRPDGSVNVNVAGRSIIGAIREHGTIRNERIDPKIRTFVSHIRSTYKIDHKLFHEYLERWWEHSLHEANFLAEGTLTIDNGTGPWLSTVFKEAKHNVFSTSIPAYMEIWRSKVGLQILQSQIRENVQCTRVFVFDKPQAVTRKDRQVMKQHAEYGICVRTFYNDEIAAFAWNPGDIDTDFTFIDDGEIIGVTDRVQGPYSSRWFFKNSEKTRQYGGYRQSLMDFSEPFKARKTA